jgi:hypothetical protein
MSQRAMDDCTSRLESPWDVAYHVLGRTAHNIAEISDSEAFVQLHTELHGMQDVRFRLVSTVSPNLEFISYRKEFIGAYKVKL